MKKRNKIIKAAGLLLLCGLLSFVVIGRTALLFQLDNCGCKETQAQVDEELSEQLPEERTLLAELSKAGRIRSVSLHFAENAPECVMMRYGHQVIASRIYTVRIPVYDGAAQYDFRMPKRIDYMEFSYSTEQDDVSSALPLVIFNEGAAGYQAGRLRFIVMAAAGTVILYICAGLFFLTKRKYPFLLLLMSVALLWLAAKTVYGYGMHPVTWGVAAISVLSLASVSYCLGGRSDEDA